MVVFVLIPEQIFEAWGSSVQKRLGSVLLNFRTSAAYAHRASTRKRAQFAVRRAFSSAPLVLLFRMVRAFHIRLVRAVHVLLVHSQTEFLSGLENR